MTLLTHYYTFDNGWFFRVGSELLVGGVVLQQKTPYQSGMRFAKDHIGQR